MQTDTRFPALPAPGSLAVLGWYAVGAAASLAGWSLVGALTQLGGGAASLAALGVGTIAAMLMAGRGVPPQRRIRAAFLLGVLTPLVVFVLRVAFVLWAFAHSGWQF